MYPLEIPPLVRATGGLQAVLKEGGMVPAPSKPVKVLVGWSGGGACGGVEKGGNAGGW